MSKQFWSKGIEDLVPYVPGEQPKAKNRLIKLNTNENPYPPSPKVQQTLAEVASASLQLYPDPDSSALKQTIANYYQVKTTQVFVGNGSDEVLAHTFVGLLKHDKPILFPDITYSFYPVYCQLFQIDYQTIALDDNWQINPADYQQANGGIIFPNPNAPTGKLLPLAEIEKILMLNTHSVVVIDEAYIDFGGQSAVELVNKYANCLVIQTFSKSRSLAGLRLGFAIGQEHLIEALERVKNSFNSYPLDRFAQAGGIAAIEDQDYFIQTTEKIIQSREYLVKKLDILGFNTISSAANFVFTSHSKYKAEFLAQQLRAQDIIVRHFQQQRIEDFLRITIGTQEECEALIFALEKITRD